MPTIHKIIVQLEKLDIKSSDEIYFLQNTLLLALRRRYAYYISIKYFKSEVVSNIFLHRFKDIYSDENRKASLLHPLFKDFVFSSDGNDNDRSRLISDLATEMNLNDVDLEVTRNNTIWVAIL